MTSDYYLVKRDGNVPQLGAFLADEQATPFDAFLKARKLALEASPRFAGERLNVIYGDGTPLSQTRVGYARDGEWCWR